MPAGEVRSLRSCLRPWGQSFLIVRISWEQCSHRPAAIRALNIHIHPRYLRQILPGYNFPSSSFDSSTNLPTVQSETFTFMASLQVKNSCRIKKNMITNDEVIVCACMYASCFTLKSSHSRARAQSRRVIYIVNPTNDLRPGYMERATESCWLVRFGWNDNCVLDPFANSGFNFPAASPSPSFESAAKKSPLRRQGVTMNRGNIFSVYHVHVHRSAKVLVRGLVKFVPAS